MNPTQKILARVEEIASTAHLYHEPGIFDATIKAMDLSFLVEAVKELSHALNRVSKVGPPSRSCKGDEWAFVCLKDNCEIAEAALAKVAGDGGENV